MHGPLSKTAGTLVKMKMVDFERYNLFRMVFTGAERGEVHEDLLRVQEKTWRPWLDAKMKHGNMRLSPIDGQISCAVEHSSFGRRIASASLQGVQDTVL